MNTESFETASAQETKDLGRKLAADLKPGDLLLLEGELGAGKTCLVQGLCEGLGFKGEVSSPTFVLVNEYRGGRLDFFHVDLYRLKVSEVDALGLEEYFEGEGASAVEWPDRLGPERPKGAWTLRLSHLGEGRRRIEVTRP